MRLRCVAIGGSLITSLFHVGQASCQQPHAVKTTSVTTSDVDSLNPRNFVEVTEVSNRGHSRLLLGAGMGETADNSPRERVNAEVDRESKLVIHIRQDILRATSFAGTFGIKGEVQTSDGSRAIEIPGYSVIGKAGDAVLISIGAASAIETTMIELED